MDADGWDRRYAASQRVWSREPNGFVAEMTAELTAGRALDLGAGEGRNAVWLAQRGWAVTAVDFAATGIARGGELANELGVTVDWRVADVLAFNAAPAAFDLVLLCYLHLPRTAFTVLLAQARSAVAPGGRLLYVGHDLSNLTDGHGGPQDPDVLATPDSVVAELPAFEIERADVVSRVVRLEPGHGGSDEAVALDTVVMARRPPA